MPAGLSLHIGVNRVDPKHYQGWDGALTACEADAQDMERVATQCGFQTQILKTEQATRSAVIGVIRGASETLHAGDIFYLSYSGHGGQIPDLNGDEDDRLDETWCLYDGELIDDELAVLWARFAAGVRILITSDCCHSGTVTRGRYQALGAAILPDGTVESAPRERGAPVRYRAMPAEVARRTYQANKSQYDEILTCTDPAAHSRIEASVLLISGCQDNQLSLDGAFNGLFTARLLQVWKDGAFTGSYPELHRLIVRQMPPTQSPNYSCIGAPNAAFEQQKPFSI
jgi:metacaspase-1